jgi:hypothetical protein
MSEADLAKLHPRILADIQQEVDDAIAAARKRRAKLDAVLDRRYGAVTTATRVREKKDSGTLRITDGGCTVIVDGKKEVKWDQDGLSTLAKRIQAGGESPALYMKSKTELSVDERTYQGWAEPLRLAFEPHRTVTVKTKYRIEPNKETE